MGKWRRDGRRGGGEEGRRREERGKRREVGRYPRLMLIHVSPKKTSRQSQKYCLLISEVIFQIALHKANMFMCSCFRMLINEYLF